MAENLFSFELRERNADGKPSNTSLGEYFLLNGPVRYTENYKYRIKTTPTFGKKASSTIDYGPDNNTISLEGEFHIHFVAKPPQASGPGFFERFDDGDDEIGFGDLKAGAKSIYDDAKSLVSDYSGTAQKLYDRSVSFMTGVFPVPGIGGVRSGEMEFHDFIAIMSGIWDSTKYESEDNQASALLSAFRAKNKPFNYTEFALIFHDYARRRHIEVIHVAEGFKISRSTEDTNTYKWEMQLLVLGDEKETAFKLPNKVSRYFNLNFESSIAQTVSALKDLVNLPTILSGKYLRMSRAFEQLSRTGTELENSWNSMRSVFASDGKFAAINFNEGFANIGRGLREEQPESLFGGILEDARSAQSEFQRRLRDLAYQLSQVMNDLAMLLIVPTQSLPAYASLPESNFQPLIESPFYPYILRAQVAVLDIEAYIRQAATDNQYIIHKAIGGDTWEALAEKFLGDPDLSSALAAYNKKRRGQGIVGRSIKIPFNHNLQVWASIPDDPSDADIERGLLGEDLALTDQRDFAIAANGDLDVVEGEVALMNNVIDQVDTPEGALPMYPDFGNPALIGEAPEVFFKDRYIDRLLARIEADERVTAASVAGIKQNGTTLEYLIRVTSKNGNQTFFLEVFP